MSNRINLLAIFVFLVLLLVGVNAWVTEKAVGFWAVKYTANSYSITGVSAKLFGAAFLFSALSVLSYWCFPKLSKKFNISESLRDFGFFCAALCFLAGVLRAIYVVFPHL